MIDTFSIITLLGGLALFLYGMSTMGDGLVMLSGGRLEKILERLTEKRIMALLLGAFVTAVIQSSSATTVMVVGFVNSGIMKLSQAAGVIMGANIGTTVTSWILSLAGIESGNVFVKLLKPSSFSPVLALIGVVMLMTAKDGLKKKITGNILIGFAILMFGMETMSGAVAPLKNNGSFTSMLTAFGNPVLGMLAGAVLTAVPAALAALDERFLDNPAFAVQLCRKAESEISDRFEDTLGTYLVKLSGHELSTEDSHLLTELLHSLSDFERISDHAVNLTEAAAKLHKNRLTITAQGLRELDCMSTAVRDIMN